MNPLSYWQRPAAHFGMSQEVLPQQITDLETATRQLSRLILRSAQQRATRSAKHKRHSWCCHAQRKALVLLSWSSWLGGGLVSAQGCVACMAMLLFCSLFFFCGLFGCLFVLLLFGSLNLIGLVMTPLDCLSGPSLADFLVHPFPQDGHN